MCVYECVCVCDVSVVFQQHVDELREVIQTLEIDLQEARNDLQVHEMQSEPSSHTRTHARTHTRMHARMHAHTHTHELLLCVFCPLSIVLYCR